MNEESAILIQCDANAETGLGHFSRSFSLARWILAEKKDMNVDFWIEKACQRAGRNLTLSEWEIYFPDEEYRVTCLQWPSGEAQE